MLTMNEGDLEKSCSPVKRGRQAYEDSPGENETNEKKIEERGSRSPDKKQRRGGRGLD